MGNVLTSLAADIYKAADMIGREQVGFLSSVRVNGDGLERVAKGDTVRSHFTREPVLNSSYTPSMTIPEGDDQTVDNKTFSINQTANVKIPWTGEDIQHVNNGPGFQTIYGDQIAQAMRKITNTIEGYLATIISKGYSRAWGTPGTTPFASNFNEVANLRKILVDNGCPMDGQVCMVMDTTAGTNLRNLANLQKANEAGGVDLLRNGVLLDLQGIKLKESGQVAAHVKGTNNGSYLINFPANYAIGDGCFGKVNSQLAVDTGAGTIVQGDYIVIGSDTNKYGVVTALSGGNLQIGETGLRLAAADNTSFVGPAANFTCNAAFHRNAVELAVRPPKMPTKDNRDAAIDHMTVQDPYSGMVYEIRAYLGYGKAMFDITTFYDAIVWKPNFVAALLG